jgi:hypothetical protein
MGRAFTLIIAGADDYGAPGAPSEKSAPRASNANPVIDQSTL